MLNSLLTFRLNTTPQHHLYHYRKGAQRRSTRETAELSSVHSSVVRMVAPGYRILMKVDWKSCGQATWQNKSIHTTAPVLARAANSFARVLKTAGQGACVRRQQHCQGSHDSRQWKRIVNLISIE